MSRSKVTATEAASSYRQNLAWTARELKAFPQGKGVGDAIRRKCLDCSGWQPGDVAECHLSRCALWPFRFGRNPFYGTQKGTQTGDTSDGEASEGGTAAEVASHARAEGG